MNLKLIRFSVICVFILFTTQLSAQDWSTDEYKAELGVNGGGSFYLGEANSVLFAYPQLAYGGFFRYKLNARLAVKAELSTATIAGMGIKPNNVYAGDFTGEFNFFDLEKNQYKRFSKIFSPYIFAGLTLMTDVYNKQVWPEFGIPFGIGIKVKLNKRWNFNAQWCTRLMLADNLEGLSAPSNGITPTNDFYNDPNGLNGSNFLNNDLLSTFTIGFSVDIWKKQCDCLNNNSRK